MSRRGRANDFLFPGSLLDQLDGPNREYIESAVIRECNNGDSRFISALSNIKTVDPYDYIDPSCWIKNDDNYSIRGEMLERMFYNTHNLELLLYLVKMSASSEMVYYNLTKIVERTDWNTIDSESELFQCFGRAILSIIFIKRVRMDRGFLYEKVFSSNLRHYLQNLSLLSSEDFSFFLQNDPWTACSNRDPLVFFKAMEKRDGYLKSKDAAYIYSIIQDIPSYPGAYDVFLFMKEIDKVDMSQFALKC